jgi:hypothetical protein
MKWAALAGARLGGFVDDLANAWRGRGSDRRRFDVVAVTVVRGVGRFGLGGRGGLRCGRS